MELWVKGSRLKANEMPRAKDVQGKLRKWLANNLSTLALEECIGFFMYQANTFTGGQCRVWVT